MTHLCCFFNYNPLYRYPIYHAMDEALGCDFYFGDSVFETLRQFPPEQLKGYKKTFHTVKTGFKDYKWHKSIKPLFKGYSAYLITGQIDYLANWLLLLYCRLTGKRIYCWTHGISQNEFKKRPTRFLYKCFFRGMHGIFMYNHYRVPLMQQLGVKADRLHVIHNSLDTETQTAIYNKLTPTDVYQRHFGNALPTAIYIGRIQARKKLDLLIEALRIANTPRRQLNLCIVGAPVEDDILHQVEKSGQQDAVWFFGPCYDEAQNAELLYNAAVCVCPAEVGLTAIHALSYGTPVVTNDDYDTQMPEFEAIANGETGSFYQKANVQSLSEHLLRWASLNEAARESVRQKARQTIEKEWSVDYQISILKRICV